MRLLCGSLEVRIKGDFFVGLWKYGLKEISLWVFGSPDLMRLPCRDLDRTRPTCLLDR